MSRTIFLSLPIMFLLAILQSAVLPLFPILDFPIQIVLLTVIVLGLLRGPAEGVIWAFIGGLCLDLFSVGPLGASAVALIIAVVATSFIQSAFPTSRLIIPVLAGGLGTIVYFGVYSILVGLVGFTVGSGAVQQLTQLAILNSLLIVPVYWFIYVLYRRLVPRPLIDQ